MHNEFGVLYKTPSEVWPARYVGIRSLNSETDVNGSANMVASRAKARSAWVVRTHKNGRERPMGVITVPDIRGSYLPNSAAKG
jgi:hypothetical protein